MNFLTKVALEIVGYENTPAPIIPKPSIPASCRWAARKISAESVSQTLITRWPEQFAVVSQDGVNLPTFRLNRGDQQILAEVERFGVEAWPNCPQYDLQTPLNPRIPLEIDGKVVHILDHTIQTSVCRPMLLLHFNWHLRVTSLFVLLVWPLCNY